MRVGMVQILSGERPRFPDPPSNARAINRSTFCGASVPSSKQLGMLYRSLEGSSGEMLGNLDPHSQLVGRHLRRGHWVS